MKNEVHETAEDIRHMVYPVYFSGLALEKNC